MFILLLLILGALCIWGGIKILSGIIYVIGVIIGFVAYIVTGGDIVKENKGQESREEK